MSSHTQLLIPVHSTYQLYNRSQYECLILPTITFFFWEGLFWYSSFCWCLEQLCLAEFECKCQDAANNSYSCFRSFSAVEDSIYCQFNDAEDFIEFYDLRQDPYQLTNKAYGSSRTNYLAYGRLLERYSTCAGHRRCFNPSAASGPFGPFGPSGWHPLERIAARLEWLNLWPDIWTIRMCSKRNRRGRRRRRKVTEDLNV